MPTEWTDNPSCEDLGYGFGFKIEGQGGADYTGIFTFTSTDGILTGGAPEDSVNTITISSDDGILLDWTSTLPLDAVFMKGGNGGNLYEYSPESTADTGLGTPDAGPALSHVEFCYDYELAAEKTADAEYTRTYTWEIDKSVDPASHEGWFGDSFTSGYQVSVDQTVADSDFKVTGEIVVNNPSPFQVGFSIEDSVNGTPATVSCPTLILAAGGSTTCTYEAGLNEPVDGTNTATITSANASVEGALASAPYAFGDPTTEVGYPEVNVTDTQPDSGAPWTASGDDSWQYTGDFACPTDESLYIDGVYSFSVPNTATIVETGQFAEQNVDVTCYKPVVSKDADTEWFEEYTWTISKSVNPNSHIGFAGDLFSSDYEVMVDQTVTAYGFRAFGTISVTNPSGGSITVNVADAVNGTDATLDCGGSLAVAAGATATCGYTVDLTDNINRTNTATVSYNGYDFQATAAVNFGDPIIAGYPDINVTDTQPDSGAPWMTSGDTSWPYTGNFACPTDESLYTDGVYSFSVPNTATIVETEQSADQNVDVICYLPASARVVKTTTEGGEDIGQFPFTFNLYDPSGALVETQELRTGGGEIVFAAELETEGTWTVEEVLPAGWVSTTELTCTFEVVFPGSADQTYTCTFDNVEKSRVDLLKLTNGVETTTQTWNFAIYEGPDGFGGTSVASDSTPPALLDFGNTDLNPFATYTLCELEVPVGYSTFWQIDTDGDGIGDATVVPYNPNANDDPPEDLGNRCVDFGARTNIPLVSGTTLHFEVDNQQPGGAPRTPGYWKNWNTCTGGNQQHTADANGGWEQGFWLLEDVLNPSIGGGIIWDDILTDDFVFTIDMCEVAVDILDKRLIGIPGEVGDKDAKKVASDPLHNLATHLLAAQLNFGAGACTTQDVLNAALAAETLLDEYNFDGNGYYDPETGRSITLKKNSADAGLANDLASYLDSYNNGAFCGDGDD